MISPGQFGLDPKHSLATEDGHASPYAEPLHENTQDGLLPRNDPIHVPTFIMSDALLEQSGARRIPIHPLAERRP